jgi:drug/metabolite transporter (DMT)-like permease
MLYYLLVSLITAGELREDQQMRRRWIAALLFGALGNAVYALIQFAGLDPCGDTSAISGPLPC